MSVAIDGLSSAQQSTFSAPSHRVRPLKSDAPRRLRVDRPEVADGLRTSCRTKAVVELSLNDVAGRLPCFGAVSRTRCGSSRARSLEHSQRRAGGSLRPASGAAPEGIFSRTGRPSCWRGGSRAAITSSDRHETPGGRLQKRDPPAENPVLGGPPQADAVVRGARRNRSWAAIGIRNFLRSGLHRLSSMHRRAAGRWFLKEDPTCSMAATNSASACGGRLRVLNFPLGHGRGLPFQRPPDGGFGG